MICGNLRDEKYMPGYWAETELEKKSGIPERASSRFEYP